MTERVFHPQTCVATLLAVMEKLYGSWALLPGGEQQTIRAQAEQLSNSLPTLGEYQRTGAVTGFLQQIETLPAAAALTRSLLDAGKAERMRMLVSVNAAQVASLQTALTQPLPVTPDAPAAQ